MVWFKPTATTGFSGTVDTFDTVDPYFADIPNFDVQSSVSNSGSAIRFDTQASSTTFMLRSEWWLPAYPTKGSTFRSWIRYDQSTSSFDWFGYRFGIQDEGNQYQADIQPGQSALRLTKKSSSGDSSLAQTSISPSSNTGYYLETEWNADDTMRVRLLDSTESELAATSLVTDSTYAAEDGFALAARCASNPSTVTVYWDDLKIVSGQGGGGTQSPGDAFAEDGEAAPTYGPNRPHAIHDASVNKTFFCYQGGDLDPFAGTYDHSTGSFVDYGYVADNPMNNDAHGAPSLTIGPNDYIHVFWGSHGFPQKYAISDNTLDTSSWTVQSDIGSELTYPKPETVNGDLYLFARQGNLGNVDHAPMTCFKSTDAGSTWSEIGPLVDFRNSLSGHRIYCFEHGRDGSDIHLAWLFTDKNDNYRRNVYHAIFDATDDSLRAMDGTSLSAPIDQTTANNNCLVFDSGGTDVETNIIRIGVDGNGYPHLIYNLYNGGTGPWTYQYQSWDGSSWTSQTQLTAHYDRFNSSEIIVNSATDIDAFLTVGSSGSSVRGGDIEYWNYDGSTWSQQSVVRQASNSPSPLNQPARVRNASSDFRWLFSTTDIGNYLLSQNVYGYGSDGYVTW